jgi:hypothetical protein
MRKTTQWTFLAAALVSLIALAQAGSAEANQQGHFGRIEQPYRQEFRPVYNHSRRELDRHRSGYRGDVRANYRSYAPPRQSAARQQIRENWRDVQNTRAVLRRHLDQYYRDREALQRAHRRGASRGEIARLRARLAASARRVHARRQELRGDYAELRRDLDRFGHDGWYDNRGRWNRNDPGWGGWGSSGWWNSPRDRFPFGYGRD